MLFALGAGLWHLLKVQKCSLNLYNYPINMQSLVLLVFPLKLINIYLMEQWLFFSSFKKLRNWHNVTSAKFVLEAFKQSYSETLTKCFKYCLNRIETFAVSILIKWMHRDCEHMEIRDSPQSVQNVNIK